MLLCPYIIRLQYVELLNKLNIATKDNNNFVMLLYVAIFVVVKITLTIAKVTIKTK